MDIKLEDLEQFRLSATIQSEPIPRCDRALLKRQSEPFLKGPVPLAWLQCASRIRRRNAIVVGVVLWWLAGLNSRKTELTICANRCQPFGFGVKGMNRGLNDLQAAGLIHVERKRGRCPRVDLLDAPSRS